jgi:hypothetical protein
MFDGDQILAEVIQAVGETLLPEIQKLINFIWNKDRLPEQWEECVIMPNYKDDDKTIYSNYHGISLLATLYKVLPNSLFSSSSPYIVEIIWNHHCGFQLNISSDQIFYVCQTLEKKWD